MCICVCGAYVVQATGNTETAIQPITPSATPLPTARPLPARSWLFVPQNTFPSP